MRIHRITFAALILGVCAVSFGIAAMRPESPSPYASLSLSSGYSADSNVGGLNARSIQIYLERSDNAWTGWMMLDPNQQNRSEFGHITETTLMAGERIDISLTLHREETATGRTCYRLNQDKFDVKMYLVFPQYSGGTYRLVICDKKFAASNVVLLEEDGGGAMIANAASTPRHE